MTSSSLVDQLRDAGAGAATIATVGTDRRPEQTPARRLVEAFGDVAAMAAMYAPDVTWRLNRSLAANISGPHVGADAVIAFNRAVFEKFYEPGSVTVEIHDELGDESSSVVRFDFSATTRRGHRYDVEYVLFATTRDDAVSEVIELLDTHASNEQHAGRAVGVRSNRT